MNWVINGKYVLVRTTQTKLKKAGFFDKCKVIKRSDLRKFSKHMTKDMLETINFVARISKDGELDINRPMYFIEF